MVAFYNNLSPSTKLLIQSFLAILGSVLAGVGAAVYQSYTTAGHLDLQGLLNVGLLTFALLFGKAMHDWIPAHAQQLLQTAQDEKAALYDALQRAQSISSAAIATNGKQVQSASSQPQIQPHVIVQPASGLSVDDIQSISSQLAINLMHMAGNPQKDVAPAPVQQASASPAQEPFPVPARPAAPPAPPVPVPDPNAYYDPMKGFSAQLPAYNPNVADQSTLTVPVAP